MSTRASPSGTRLCSRCKAMKVWGRSFRIEDRLSDLEQLSLVCDFCLLRWNTCKDLGIQALPNSKAVFDRSGSHFTVNGRYPPVLSIFQEPGTWTSSRTLWLHKAVERYAHKCAKQQPLAISSLFPVFRRGLVGFQKPEVAPT